MIILACGSELDPLSQNESPAYYSSTAVWQTLHIPVCWESPPANTALERTWVRDAIATTWSGRSNLHFIGWGVCQQNSAGIRIRIADERPRVLALGSRINGIPGGMVLNFTFGNWATGCQQAREQCIRGYAVHEFGHAISFSHEHNRPDTPSSCNDAPQGENGDMTIGEWDLHSVMNYCNPILNNGAGLSATDVRAVQTLYGTELWRPGSRFAAMNNDGFKDFCRVTGKDGVFGSRVACTLLTAGGFGFTVSSGLLDPGHWFGRDFTDVTGDLRADYCRVTGTQAFVDSRLACTPSLSNGFGATFFSPIIDWGYEAGRAWVDVNGDKRADFCRVVGSQPFVDSRVQCTVTNPSSFGPTFTSGVLDWGYPSDRAWADVDGDRRADFCRRVGTRNLVDSRVQCTRTTGNGFGETFTSGVLDWGHESGRAWVDFNGDGRADFCRVVGATPFVDGKLQCTLSTGSGFGATITSGVVDWGYEDSRSWTDHNGDGATDFCRVIGGQNFVNSRVSCTLSNRSSFGATYNSSVIDWGYTWGRHFSDVNGDGRGDYIRIVGGPGDFAEQVTYSTGTGFGASVRSQAVY